MVTIRSSFGISFNNARKNDVLPLDVPPETRIRELLAPPDARATKATDRVLPEGIDGTL